MKAVRIFGKKDIRLTQIPSLSPQNGDVLCRVVKAGICGTDYSIYTGEASFVKSGLVPFPMTPGHEWSGVVEQVGPNVENFKSGDKVIGDTAVSCGVCYDCLMGQYYQCKKCRAVGTLNTWDGAYAESILMPARHLFKIPENVTFDNAAMVEPAATALLAVAKADVKLGETVLVLGSGPIGIAAAKLAKLSGASKVMITGRKKNKLDCALSLGVDAALNTSETSLREGVQAYFNDKVDKIIEASGSTELLAQANDVIHTGGIISLVAFYENPIPSFDLDALILNNIKLIPVPGSLGMYKPILQMMSSGLLDLTGMIDKRCRLDDVPEVLAGYKSQYGSCMKFMIEMDSSK